MKRFLQVLTMSLCAAFPVAQALAVEFTVNGDFRVRGFLQDNLTDANDAAKDNNSFNSERFILNLGFKSSNNPINVEGVLTTDFTSSNGTGNTRFGDFAFGPAQRTAATCGGGTATACSQNTFAILQAYIKVNSPYGDFTAGRQVFKLGHGLLVADAVDAFVFDIPIRNMTLQFANLKIFDSSPGAAAGGVFVGNGTGGFTGGDTDLYTINLKLSPIENSTLNGYVGFYADRGPTFITRLNAGLTGYTNSAKAEMFIFGLAGEATIGRFNTLFEADILRGGVTDPTTGGTRLHGHNILAGINTDVGPGNVGLTFVYSSGQKAGDVTSGSKSNINGINGDYPLGIITTNVGARSPAPVDGTCPSFSGGGLGGRPGCFGGSGLITFKVSGNVTPPSLPKLNIEGAVLYNMASEDRPIRTTAASATYINGGDQIGTELDIIARYAVTPELSLTAGYGYLIAGDFFEAPTAATVSTAGSIAGNPTTQNADNLSVGVLEMRYQF